MPFAFSHFSVDRKTFNFSYNFFHVIFTLFSLKSSYYIFFGPLFMICSWFRLFSKQKYFSLFFLWMKNFFTPLCFCDHLEEYNLIIKVKKQLIENRNFKKEENRGEKGEFCRHLWSRKQEFTTHLNFLNKNFTLTFNQRLQRIELKGGVGKRKSSYRYWKSYC